MLTVRAEYRMTNLNAPQADHRMYQAERYVVRRVEAERPPRETKPGHPDSFANVPETILSTKYWRTDITLYRDGYECETLHLGECEELCRIFVMNDMGKTVDTLLW